MAELILRPNGDKTTQFSTAYPSGSHYTNVKEATADDYSSYNLAPKGANNVQDLYYFEDHTTEEGEINSVTVHARVCRNHAEDKLRLIVNGNSSGNIEASAGWSNQSWKPDGPWTWTDIDNIYAGIEALVVTDRIVISQIYIVVDYTPRKHTLFTFNG